MNQKTTRRSASPRSDTLHTAAEDLRHEKPSENLLDVITQRVDGWTISTRVIAVVGIVGFLMSLVQIGFLVRDAIRSDHSSPVVIATSVLSVLVVVMTIYLVAESRRAHRIDADRSLLEQMYRERLDRHLAKEESLALIDDDKDRLLTNAKSIEQLKSNGFRDIAMGRAFHSTTLYAIQNRILESDGKDGVSFEKSWERQQEFLDRYCSMANQLFSGVKGGQVCVNVKVAWDSKVTTDLTEVLHTEFGVDRSVDPNDVLYQAIARCHVSKNNGRQVGEQNHPVPLRANFIFRKFYNKKMPNFLTNNIAEDIARWKIGFEEIGEDEDFVFPDDETTKYYSKLICVPIFIEGIRYPLSNIKGEMINRFIGILSIDSDDPKVMFDNQVDTPMAEQIAFDMASCFYEYFRCVKHLEIRSKRSPD